MRVLVAEKIAESGVERMRDAGLEIGRASCRERV